MSAVHSMSIGVINSFEAANKYLGADNVTLSYKHHSSTITTNGEIPQRQDKISEL